MYGTVFDFHKLKDLLGEIFLYMLLEILNSFQSDRLITLISNIH